ncbi:unnamed protein product [Gongylonema pulchrum]|uniref:Transmembrane protein n=1 Tax=Gongylonema pulchrum TaxID=637853 RepID=A0A183DIR2_9BILA|nr:unnamed protein product [Gongylonema pulchrum]
MKIAKKRPPTATNLGLFLTYLTSAIVCIMCLSNSSSKCRSSAADDDVASKQLWHSSSVVESLEFFEISAFSEKL